MSDTTLVKVVEVLLLGAGRALSIEELSDLVAGTSVAADAAGIKSALDELGESWSGRGLELAVVASGYRLQVRSRYAEWLARAWAERPARYSRALMETLALIAYRQPVTRGEIEDVRGVSVSQSIVKTLLERDWIRVLGHRDVPGRPAIYGTTRTFLDDFNLTGLEDLPPLAEVRDIDRFHEDLFGEQAEEPHGADGEPQADAPEAEADAAEADVAGPDSADAVADGETGALDSHAEGGADTRERQACGGP